MKNKILVLLFFIISTIAFAQNRVNSLEFKKKYTIAQRDALSLGANDRVLIYVVDTGINEQQIWDGDSWETVGGGDNLGNHTATQNLLMGEHWIDLNDLSDGTFPQRALIMPGGLVFQNNITGSSWSQPLIRFATNSLGGTQMQLTAKEEGDVFDGFYFRTAATDVLRIFDDEVELPNTDISDVYGAAKRVVTYEALEDYVTTNSFTLPDDLKLGDEDTTNGSLTVHGNSTTTGGKVIVENPADNDTEINNYSFETINGNAIFKANGGSNGSAVPLLTFNKTTLQTGFGNYEFPRADGTAGQVLTTDGSGQMTFEDLPLYDFDGVERYDAVADLPGTGVATTSYKVTADPTASNNGFYSWNGSSYDKDADLYNGDIAVGETEAVTGDKIARKALGRYPFQQNATFESTLIDISDFILDVKIYGGNANWRVAPFTIQRNVASVHYLRLAVYDETDTKIDAVGDNGLIAKWNETSYTEPTLVNGKRLDKITFDINPGLYDVDKVEILVDWEAIADGSTYLPQSYNKAGFDSKVFDDNRLNVYVSSEQVFDALPQAEEKTFAKTNVFDTGYNNKIIRYAKIYGVSDKTKRYGIEILRYEPTASGRSFIGVCEYAEDGTKGSRVAMWDDTNYQPITVVNGKQLETVTLSEVSSSGITVVLELDWAQLPLSGTFWNGSYWYTNTFQVEDGEFSYNTFESTTPHNGYFVDNVTINGINARITTSDGYNSEGESDYLILIFHGNGGDYTYTPSSRFTTFCKNNKISFAVITGQDETATPFTTTASGWGNDIYLQRYLSLYKYCIDNYNFNESVILAGVSMGGLAMGHFAYTRPFPVLFCLGVGAVPDLELMFTAGSTSRKEAIRNAYGMDAGGTDDAAIADFIQGYNWYANGKVDIGGTDYKFFDSHLYMYLGTGDTVATTEFGGISNYNAIRDMINLTGGYCITKDLGAGESHASSAIWDEFLDDEVFKKELGIEE